MGLMLPLAGTVWSSRAAARPPAPFAADADCPASLTRLFAPAVPSGATVDYLVCRSRRTFDDLRPAGWPIRETTVAEAFAGAGRDVVRSLTFLYGGRRVRVARGWMTDADGLESIALIAPPPADSLDRIAAGTLIIHAHVRRQTRRGRGL